MDGHLSRELGKVNPLNAPLAWRSKWQTLLVSPGQCQWPDLLGWAWASPTVVTTMVISCKRSCVSAGHHAHAPSGYGIWEELKSNLWCSCSVGHTGSCVQLLSHSAFDFVAVVIAQFGLTTIEQVAKFHRFAVRSCCCHALSKLDSSAKEIYSI